MICKVCGNENPDVNKFCQYCGAELTAVPVVDSGTVATNNAVVQEKDSSTPTIVTVLLLIFIFPIGVIVMWFWPKWKTWIKLLITALSIIPVLLIFLGSVLLAVNPVGTMQKSRDVTRLNDASSLARAINTAVIEGDIRLVSTRSCTTCSSDAGTQALDGKNGWVKFEILNGSTGLIKYIPELPVDPINDSEYVYTFSSGPSGFEINVVLETVENESKMSEDRGNDPEKYEVGTDLSIK